MRKNIALIIGLFIAITFTGCSAKDSNSNKSEAASSQKVIESGSDKEQSGITKEAEKPKQPEKPKEPSLDGKSNKDTAISKQINANTAASSTNTNANSRVIVIDPGHANRSNLEKEPIAPGSSQMKIKDGGGAEGVVTKTSEQSINLKVAFKLRDLLQSKGYTVIMTKTREDQSLGNVERAEIGNRANAALVIRIHADSDKSSAKGASMLVPAAINENTKSIYASSKKYGSAILNTLVGEVGMPNRGVIESSDMTGFNWSKVPVVLIEMGFLSNSEEDRLLSSQAYQDKLVKGLADGISSIIK